MKSRKRITAMILSVCMLLGLVFVPTQAQEASTNGSGHRGDAYNNGITAAETPLTKEESGLLWAQKLGQYAGPPLYANGSIYTYWENQVYKLNRKNGKVEAKGTIALDPNNSWAQAFGYTYFPVTYGDGKIYVGMGGGKVQAFDADTLESVWIYTNGAADSGTDAYSPITYKDGKIYTGFNKSWSSSAPAAFVCISTKDGKEVWSTTEDGSFNWDGAAIIGDYVVYGNGSGSIISRNKNTGEFVQKETADSKEIKASACYDNGKVYFMTGSATLVVADFNLEAGTFSNIKKIDCSKYGTGSTSTPVVYNGIVYVGVGKWGSGKIIAVNPEEEKVLWSVDEPSYPQCSILLSNAYEKDGYLYLYVTYNGKPGGINVVKVKADGSEAEGYELFAATGYEQFCMSSVVVDEDGIIYYKNDSGYVMAIAKSDKTKVAELEKKITDLPDEKEISLADEEAIKEVRAEYESLTDAQKKFVSDEAVKILETAEAKINTLKTAKALGELPDSAKITLENEKEVAEVRKQYDALTRKQKKELSSEDVLNLFDAEKKIAQLKAEAAKEVSAKDAQAAEKVEKQIMAIGTVTLAKVKKVEAVKAEYDKLTKEQKRFISVEAVVTLKDAVAATNKYVKDTKTNAYYKIIKTGSNNTVAYIKPIAKKAAIVIPAQITVEGRTYKVASICAKAFYKNTALKKVVIGKNISKIGKEAFYGCKNLKKLQIKSKKLSAKSIGKNAFKGINKKAKMSAPKSKVKVYKKWLKIK